MHHFILTALIFLLTACSSTPPDKGLLPPPTASTDLSNEQLRTDLNAYLQSRGHPLSSSYDISRIDLNGDKSRDALVFLNTPYGYWCDTNGCPMLVFKAGQERFTFTNETKPVRSPIYVSRLKTKGWKDIVMRVSGRREDAKIVELKFNGSTYPADPSRLAASDTLPALMPGYTLVYDR